MASHYFTFRQTSSFCFRDFEVLKDPFCDNHPCPFKVLGEGGREGGRGKEGERSEEGGGEGRKARAQGHSTADNLLPLS